jgi:predicted nuclease of predicted toxin-antitoxin system
MMARFYSNENFPLPVVEELRRLGHDVLTVQEAGKANQEIPDDEVLAFASADNRAVLTINRRDFIRLHRQNQNHSGVIVCTADLDFARQARGIHEAIATLSSLANQLIRVNRPAQLN